jgi:hypothetical protein
MTLRNLTKFLECFANALDGDGQQIARSHANRLRMLQAALSTINDVPDGRVPVQTICEVELEANRSHSPLSKALWELMPAIHLTRSKTYMAAPPSADFGDNYGYGVICGPDSGPPALIKDSEIAFGLMLLGPKTHYPLHHHPADELYYTVTGPSFWRAGRDPWGSRGTGEIIHHPSWMPHATLSGDRPLVLLYIWKGDLETDAVFIPDFMTPDAALRAVGSEAK